MPATDDPTGGLELFGVLAAGVAHQINNPLAAAIANLDLALDALRRGTADVSEEIADARDAAERVRQIVRDLGMFSGGGLRPSREVDVALVVETAVRVARHALPPRATIVEHYDAPALVEATDTRLAQAVLTVLLAAGKGAHELHVAVRVHGDRVDVEVASPAAGELSSLDAARRIVGGFGGRVLVEPGGVRIELPGLAPDDSEEPVARRGRILSIDDEPTIGVAIRRILGARHEVVWLDSAEAALSLLARGERFDVLLCDVIMPGMTGIELFQVLTRDHPDQAERVIFLTGGPHSARASAFLEASGVLRIEKPFDARELREIVDDRLR